MEFLVVDDTKATPIIGEESAVDLKFIKRIYKMELENKENFVREYKSVFEGLGKLPNKYDIQLKEDARPTVKPPRRFPQVIVDKLKEALGSLVKQQIISPVTESTD